MFCYCFVGLAFKEEGICEEEALEKFRVGEEGGEGSLCFRRRRRKKINQTLEIIRKKRR